MFKPLMIAAVALAAGAAASPALAQNAVFTISGVWGASAPSTPYSHAGEAFSLSFEMPQVYTYVTTNGGYSIPTTVPATELSNFTYSLNSVDLPITMSPVLAPGCSASLALCGVEIYNLQRQGGFTLDFGDYSVNFFARVAPRYGAFSANMGANGVLNFGTYDLLPNINAREAPPPPKPHWNEGLGVTLGTITPAPGAPPALAGVFSDRLLTPTVVPEPSSWALLLAGAFGLGAMLRGRRRSLPAV